MISEERKKLSELKCDDIFALCNNENNKYLFVCSRESATGDVYYHFIDIKTCSLHEQSDDDDVRKQLLTLNQKLDLIRTIKRK